MATNQHRNQYSNMTELEIIASMNDKDLTRCARMGGRDAIYEVGYRLQGTAAANTQQCHDGVMADNELDIGV